MSSSSSALSGQLRQRAARLGEGGLRHRLALVHSRDASSPRMPFVMVVALILAAGVVGLLMFNTHMQQGAFKVNKLQAQASALSALAQDEAMQVQKASNPQQLAAAASKLGMVAPANPAFLDLATGRVLGVPTAATAKGAVNIAAPGAAPTPPSLAPAPKIVIVPPPAAPTNATPTNATPTNARPNVTQTPQAPSSTAKTNPNSGAAGH